MADIYLLPDVTGSMGSYLTAVQAGANTIIADLSASLAGADLRFGVGQYRDFGDPSPFDNLAPLTTDAASVQAAISSWTADYGGDYPEGQLYALDRLGSAANPAGFRESAAKIIVMFGDAPSERCSPAWPDVVGAARCC